MFELNYLALFLAGLLGGGHCAGMCGGIVAAFSMNLPTASRWKWHVFFNVGRISGYALMGGVLAGIAHFATQTVIHQAQFILFLIAHILLIGMGLQIAAWSLWVNQIEKCGQPVWRRVKPLLAKLLPVKNLWQCFAAGMLWGWLPCGLVYTASLAAMSSANPWSGAGLMLVFGLGTLPNLLLIALGSELLRDWMRNRWLRRFFGTILIAFGVYPLVLLMF